MELCISMVFFDKLGECLTKVTSFQVEALFAKKPDWCAIGQRLLLVQRPAALATERRTYEREMFNKT